MKSLRKQLTDSESRLQASSHSAQESASLRNELEDLKISLRQESDRRQTSEADKAVLTSRYAIQLQSLEEHKRRIEMSGNDAHTSEGKLQKLEAAIGDLQERLLTAKGAAQQSEDKAQKLEVEFKGLQAKLCSANHQSNADQVNYSSRLQELESRLAADTSRLAAEVKAATDARLSLETQAAEEVKKVRQVTPWWLPFLLL